MVRMIVAATVGTLAFCSFLLLPCVHSKEKSTLEHIKSVDIEIIRVWFGDFGVNVQMIAVTVVFNRRL